MTDAHAVVPGVATSAKPGASLLERAGRVYDFGAHLRRAAGNEDLDHDRPRVAAPELPPLLDAFPAKPASGHHGAPDDRSGNTADRPTAAIDRTRLVEQGLIVPGAPVGPLVEEFRLIKRQLLQAARGAAARIGDRARIVLVCSARANDGKTFCAVNLAISLAAERDTRVLLIDADLAKPDVMNRLGLKAGPGLLDALADPTIDINDLVVATDIAQLSLLPAGARANDDTELLTSARAGERIAALVAADPGRIVIFDSPPALAASPASVLAHHAGQVLLVVRADRTNEADLREAVALLDGCERIQLVLNAVTFRPRGSRFGSYYSEDVE